jgi:glutathione synthase/RimK-type ligase-like ATP-grasp enzyme
VPVPEALNGSHDILPRLRDDTSPHHWPTAYIKLNTGSSATGIVVLHQTVGERVEFGITTLSERDGTFSNTRLVRRVTGQALENAVEFIRSEGAIVQRGIPLAQIDGQNFDVRVVCVYGKPVATIFRLSSHPMTNLHLGGRRGEFERCRKSIPTRDWLDALDHCTDAASCFDSAIAGVDLVFERGSYCHYILEVNAFGDFFPGWTDVHGRSAHTQEITATAARFG